jgi:prophage regulatory protein
MNNTPSQRPAVVADEPIRLVRLPEVMRRTGLSRPTVYRYIVAGRFPKPAKIGAMTCWISEEITSWINERVTESRQAIAE